MATASALGNDSPPDSQKNSADGAAHEPHREKLNAGISVVPVRGLCGTRTESRYFRVQSKNESQKEPGAKPPPAGLRREFLETILDYRRCVESIDQSQREIPDPNLRVRFRNRRWKRRI